MDRTGTTEVLSALLRRDVLGGKHYASEVKYAKLDGCGIGRVDFMSFECAGGDAPSDANVQRGLFTCYEVKSCIDDYRSGHGLNFIGDRNAIVCPMGLYKEIGAELGDIAVYVPVPWWVGPDEKRMSLMRQHADPKPLTDDMAAWRMTLARSQVQSSGRRHGTAELLFAMLKAGRR